MNIILDNDQNQYIVNQQNVLKNRIKQLEQLISGPNVPQLKHDFISQQIKQLHVVLDSLKHMKQNYNKKDSQ